MSHYLAVIDLGTNTFHLLIWKVWQNGFHEEFRKRIFVNLGEEGIETIGDNAIQRGLEAIDQYVIELSRYPNYHLRIIGTAALRTAKNGKEFTHVVFEKTSTQVELIDGNREAELIFKGTSQIVDIVDNSALIMDIGGGSVEFILSKNGEAVWWRSFKIGVSILYRKFHHSEPISAVELSNLSTFIRKKLKPLRTIIIENKPQVLIGASGSFEVIDQMLGNVCRSNDVKKFSYKKLYPYVKTLVSSSQEERLAMDNIPNERVKLVVVAFILIDEVVRMLGVNSIMVSPYALKEGVLSEMIENLESSFLEI